MFEFATKIYFIEKASSNKSTRDKTINMLVKLHANRPGSLKRNLPHNKTPRTQENQTQDFYLPILLIFVID